MYASGVSFRSTLISSTLYSTTPVEAFYNPDQGRVEIYIRSLLDQIVRVGGRPVRFAQGERTHVEYSYKYSTEEFRRLAGRAGFQSLLCWTDDAALFSVHYLTAQ